MAVATPNPDLAPLRVQGDSSRWVQCIPDGAVSVGLEGSSLVLRASQRLQGRFEELLVGWKAGTLSPEEAREYEAICDLDEVLSYLNRLARGARSE